MRTIVGLALGLALIGAPIEAQAENGQVAAGILGGLAVFQVILLAKAGNVAKQEVRKRVA